MLKYSPCLRQTLITHILLTLKPDAILGVRAGIQKNNPFATAITAKVVFFLRQLPLPKNKLLSFAAVKQPPLPHFVTEVISILKVNSAINIKGTPVSHIWRVPQPSRLLTVFISE